VGDLHEIEKQHGSEGKRRQVVWGQGARRRQIARPFPVGAEEKADTLHLERVWGGVMPFVNGLPQRMVFGK